MVGLVIAIVVVLMLVALIRVATKIALGIVEIAFKIAWALLSACGQLVMWIARLIAGRVRQRQYR